MYEKWEAYGRPPTLHGKDTKKRGEMQMALLARLSAEDAFGKFEKDVWDTFAAARLWLASRQKGAAPEHIFCPRANKKCGRGPESLIFVLPLQIRN